jgi:predicted ester cyclase
VDATEVNTIEEQNKAIVVDLYERIHRGELSAMDGHPGLAETRVYLPLALAAFPDLSARTEQVVAEGDRVAIHIWLRGTHLGDLAGIPATGKAVEFQLISIERVKEGRIIQHNSEAGWMHVLMQLGALPARGETAVTGAIATPTGR